MLPAANRLPPADQPRPTRGRRLRGALTGSLRGRLVLGGAAVKLLTYVVDLSAGSVPGILDFLDRLASVALIVGLAWFMAPLVTGAKRRLLWRVRRKLILSYVFIGVVPVLLIASFFLLTGVMLFLNVGSYLVRSAFGDVIDEARFVAEAVAVDINTDIVAGGVEAMLRSSQAKLTPRYPGASVALVPTGSESCSARAAGVQPGPADGAAGLTAPPRSPAAGAAVPARGGARAEIAATAVGPWHHLRAPRALPTWARCSGYAGLLGIDPGEAVTGGRNAEPTYGAVSPAEGEDEAYLVIRAVAVSDPRNPRFAVVVDLPVTGTLAERIRETTSIKLGSVSLEEGEAAGGPLPQATAAPIAPAPAPEGALGEALPRKRRLQWVAFLEYVDWPTGVPRRATMSIEVNIADIYERLSAGQARLGPYSVGSAILLVLLLLGVLFLIIEAAALVMGLVLARSITGSVHQLFAGTERVRLGDLGHRIEVRTRDQLGELAESFNEMTQSITDLLRETEEKKRLEEELRIARSVQMSLLPRGDLGVPGLSISALCVPAREVGGDYYDVLRVDDQRIGVLIADVSGKGTSAAFYMAELKGLMLSLSRIHRSPRQLLIDANRIISDHLDSRSFITMTYAIIDTTARTMTYARAGHTPLVYRPAPSNGDQGVRILTPDGLVLGLRIEGGAQLFERLLREETLALQHGDLLLFFTDGISEAMNEDSDCFGEARLSRLVDEHGDLPSDELRERILREIEGFVGGAPQHDDMTMILVKVE